MAALPGPWALLTSMRDCLCEAIEQAGAGREVCWCGILPGAVAVHDFAEGGQAWVRLVSSFPTDNFPNPSSQPRCYMPQAYTVEVGIVRCAATTDGHGNAPTPAEQAYVAEVQMADMELMRRAIQCCVGKDYDYVLGNYLPFGPAGIAVGGVWTFAAILAD